MAVSFEIGGVIVKTGLTIAFIIICVIIVILVLCQEAKDNGLGILAGSGSTDTYWGKNKGRDMKAVATTVLVVLFLGIALLISSKFLN